MIQTIGGLLGQAGLGEASLLMALVGIGSCAGLFGLYGAFAGGDPTMRRLRPGPSAGSGQPQGGELVRRRSGEPSALLKALIPAERKQRTQVERELAYAGITGKNAVLHFYLVRALLGMSLPLIVLAIRVVAPAFSIPGVTAWLYGLSQMETFQILGILGAAGFFGPTYWLSSNARARKRRISEGFPNALDLLQIAAEAGLGFDASMAKVAAEIGDVSPDIAHEFRLVQEELLAGRDRDKALMEMAERMNIDEAVSFVNVILQSKRFGTSISEALLTYATEMRYRRELAAQEKANRLPVQMSAVMATLMLPAMFLITLTPVVLRFMRYFAET